MTATNMLVDDGPSLLDQAALLHRTVDISIRVVQALVALGDADRARGILAGAVPLAGRAVCFGVRAAFLASSDQSLLACLDAARVAGDQLAELEELEVQLAVALVAVPAHANARRCRKRG